MRLSKKPVIESSHPDEDRDFSGSHRSNSQTLK